MEFLKGFLFSLASILMAVIIFIAPGVSQTVCVFYVMILSGYLGLDVWNMIDKTRTLPKDEYKSIKVNRYVICSFFYILLVVCGYIETAKTGVNLDTLFSVLLSAVFAMVAILIGGLEGNKAAMLHKKENEKEVVK